MENVTWNDICSIFSEVYDSPVESTEHEITCDKLEVMISRGIFSFEGSISINKRPIAKARIVLSTSGIAISAEVQEWSIDDGFVLIKNAHVKLLVGKGSSSNTESASPAAPEIDSTKHRSKPLPGATDLEESTVKLPSGNKADSHSVSTMAATTVTTASSDSGWQGGLEVIGDVLINEHITIKAALAVKRDKNGIWFWVVCGQMTADLSLREFVQNIEAGSEFDLHLGQVTVLASSVDDPFVSYNTYGYEIKKGTLPLQHIRVRLIRNKTGFYVCATLEKVPLLNGERIKRPVAEDKSYLSLGYAPGAKFPSVAIFLPQSVKVGSVIHSPH